jgi:hypothetical protein
MNHLFKLQVNKDTYGSNLSMRRFKDYLAQIHETLEDDNKTMNEKADKVNKKQVILMEQDGNLLVNIHKIGQDRASQSVISSAEVQPQSTTGRNKNKKSTVDRGGPSPKIRTSKKKKKSAVRLAEQNIIEFLARANY